MTGSRSREIRVAATPTNFGVQRLLPANALAPDPCFVLDVLADIGYDGISLGPPGYLGEGQVLRRRTSTRGLRLAEAFIPMHFSRPELFGEERENLHKTLTALSEITEERERPLVVLSEGFREPSRWMHAGRAGDLAELVLPPQRFSVMIGNLQRAAEDCRDAGFEPVLHHHAGTFIETDDEIRRVFDALDTTLLGMCLDTAHACLGHSEPLNLIRDYHSVIRNVHLKDLSLEIVAASNAREQSLTELTIEGAFVPLGEGGAGIPDILDRLRSQGYRGWMVIEQDRFVFDDADLQTAVGDQQRNLEFLLRCLEPHQHSSSMQ